MPHARRAAVHGGGARGRHLLQHWLSGRQVPHLELDRLRPARVAPASVATLVADATTIAALATLASLVATGSPGVLVVAERLAECVAKRVAERVAVGCTAIVATGGLVRRDEPDRLLGSHGDERHAYGGRADGGRAGLLGAEGWRHAVLLRPGR